MKLKFIKSTKNDFEISIPTVKKLHGVEIKKLPNGQYIKALQVVKDLPKILIEACFPNRDIDNMLDFFKNADYDKIMLLVGQLLAVAPEQFLRLVSELTDIPFDTLMWKLTPNQTLEILQAYWEANDYTPFFESLKELIAKSSLAKEITSLTNEQTQKSSLTKNIGLRSPSKVSGKR